MVYADLTEEDIKRIVGCALQPGRSFFIVSHPDVLVVSAWPGRTNLVTMRGWDTAGGNGTVMADGAVGAVG